MFDIACSVHACMLPAAAREVEIHVRPITRLTRKEGTHPPSMASQAKYGKSSQMQYASFIRQLESSFVKIAPFNNDLLTPTPKKETPLAKFVMQRFPCSTTGDLVEPVSVIPLGRIDDDAYDDYDDADQQRTAMTTTVEYICDHMNMSLQHLELIGKGAWGRVYKTFYYKKPVAIKVQSIIQNNDLWMQVCDYINGRTGTDNKDAMLGIAQLASIHNAAYVESLVCCLLTAMCSRNTEWTRTHLHEMPFPQFIDSYRVFSTRASTPPQQITVMEYFEHSVNLDTYLENVVSTLEHDTTTKIMMLFDVLIQVLSANALCNSAPFYIVNMDVNSRNILVRPRRQPVIKSLCLVFDDNAAQKQHRTAMVSFVSYAQIKLIDFGFSSCILPARMCSTADKDIEIDGVQQVLRSSDEQQKASRNSTSAVYRFCSSLAPYLHNVAEQNNKDNDCNITNNNAFIRADIADGVLYDIMIPICDECLATNPGGKRDTESARRDQWRKSAIFPASFSAYDILHTMFVNNEVQTRQLNLSLHNTTHSLGRIGIETYCLTPCQTGTFPHHTFLHDARFIVHTIE